jgi:hypothetical protein
MRYLIFFVGIYFLAFSLWNKPFLVKIVIHDKDKIKVIFTNQLSKEDLVKIKSKGIDIFYNRTSFDYDGRLCGIAFSVDCKDGFSGTTNTDHLNFMQRVGFIRDYSLGASSAFMIGSL